MKYLIGIIIITDSKIKLRKIQIKKDKWMAAFHNVNFYSFNDMKFDKIDNIFPFDPLYQYEELILSKSEYLSQHFLK